MILLQKGERLFTPPPAEGVEEKVDSIEALLNPQKTSKATETEQHKPDESKKEEHAEEPKEEKKEEVKDDKKKKKKQVKKFVIEPKVLTEEEIEAMKKKETLSAVVKLVQAHERGRQARLYFSDKWSVRKPDANTAPVVEVEPKDPEKMEQAASGFERLYRGHRVRREMKRRENDRRLLIGEFE